MFGEPDPLKIVGNTAALHRERARRKAAWREGQGFYFSGLVLLVVGIGLNPIAAGLHAPAPLRFVGPAVSLCAVVSMLISFVRQRRYLKSHPSDV